MPTRTGAHSHHGQSRRHHSSGRHGHRQAHGQHRRGQHGHGQHSHGQHSHGQHGHGQHGHHPSRGQRKARWIFDGCRLGFRVGSALPGLRALADGSNVVRNGFKVAEIIGKEAADCVVQAGADCSAEIIAGFGIAYNFLKTVQNVRKVCQAVGGLNAVSDQTFIASGAPKVALQGVERLLERKRNAAIIEASRHAAAGTVKTILLAADGGAASTAGVGLANALAGFCHTLMRLVQEAMDMHKGNKFLGRRKMSIEMFKECPILGCYYLQMADTSDILDLVAIEDESQWTQATNKVSQLKQISLGLINASNLTLTGGKNIYKSPDPIGILDTVAKAALAISPYLT